MNYFEFNLKASEVMLGMLQNEPQVILRKSGEAFGDYLQGMTFLWSTQERLNQVR